MSTPEYHSTARALAQPIEEEPPEHEHAGLVWQRHYRRSGEAGETPLTFGERVAMYRERIPEYRKKVGDYVEFGRTTYARFTPIQRILIGVACVIVGVLGVLLLIYHDRFFHLLSPYAEKWRNLPFGWLIIWVGICIVSFPPLIGYGALLGAAGFVYGFPYGWFIVASATVFGSTISLLLSRTILVGYTEKWIGQDPRFEALKLVLKHDGLRLLVFWRLCPLPYSMSNGVIAMIPTVPWTQFALSTVIATPKLMIHIFIGSRLAALGESGEKMDTKTKVINYASIVIGAVFGAATGWIIYNQTKKRAAELEAQDLEADGGGPEVPRLSREYSDDVVAAGKSPSLRRGRDDISLHDAREEEDYQDFWSDEDDVFRHGDNDDDEEPRGRTASK